MAADAAGHAEHLVAGPEARDAGPERLDRAGRVDAEDGREGVPSVFGGTCVDLRVERVHAAGGNADQDLAWRWRWPGDGHHPERFAVGVEHGGLHGWKAGHRGSSLLQGNGATFSMRLATIDAARYPFSSV